MDRPIMHTVIAEVKTSRGLHTCLFAGLICHIRVHVLYFKEIHTLKLNILNMNEKCIRLLAFDDKAVTPLAFYPIRCIAN